MKLPTKAPRIFLPENLEIKSWESLEPFFINLKERSLETAENMEKWLLDLSEVEAVVEEDLAWRYIRMTVDTCDKKLTDRYQDFVVNIQPQIAPFADAFNKKLITSPCVDALEGKAYEIYLRKIRTEISLYQEENIALLSELQSESQQFGNISGKMSVEVGGNKMTMQQAGAEMQKTDRAYREKVWRSMHSVRMASRQELDDLYSNLVRKRHQVAQNAGFENFRDYKFKSLGRFDYTKEDCFDFHNSIAKEISPLLADFQLQRKEKLGVEKLMPWDLAVDPEQNPPLKPFESVEELTQKSIQAFNQVDSFCGTCLGTMDKMGHLDLASKEGKAPGGYNYPLYEIGIPFIFMNAVGTPRDLVTMMHEGGHAVHSFLTRNLKLTAFQSCPSEVAELASMSMELISMDQWNIFYSNPDDLKRAKKEHLEDLLAVLPWIAIIDKFQHWIYENPKHTTEDRTAAWLSIYKEFTPDIVDFSGMESAREILWQKQLHLFEVPFYYIEYGMAQLGAIAVWRNYKENPTKALEQYKSALALGYTQGIEEIYKTAGIRFDFSQQNVAGLVEFVKGELEMLD